MSKFKNKIEEILEKHCFVDTEHKDFFEAMSEILETIADRIEEKEPYAKLSIKSYRDVAREVFDIDDVLETNK